MIFILLILDSIVTFGVLTYGIIKVLPIMLNKPEKPKSKNLKIYR